MSDGPFSGKVEIQDGTTQPKVTIILDGNSGDVSAGGNGQIGSVATKNQAGADIITLGHAFLPVPGAPPGAPPFPLASA